MSDTISKALAAAQKVHDDADKKFPTPHEYSNAPYSVAKKAATPPAPASSSPSIPSNAEREKETGDTATGLAWNIKQRHDADKQD